ncbi:potassium channel protein - like protein [Thioalkalivibrio nitratireducens]|nr:potassium channel protein - like protein [Thioalkalivibrio nitratireducens]
MTADSPRPRSGSAGRERLMFLVSLVMLLLLGLVLPHGGVSEDVSTRIWAVDSVRWALLACWILIVLESLPALISWRRDDARSARKRFLLVLLLPPLRVALSPHAPARWLWLPGVGWQQRDENLFHRLELGLAIPMLVVAFLILPVLVGEFLFHAEIESSPVLAWTLHTLTSVIWLAFALEFMVMISVAPKKLQYAREHWINLLIIVLPLVAFLRSLALFRALRLAKVSKIFQTVRLRVLLTRAYRIALLLNLLERVLARYPRYYLALLKAREERKQAELDDIRARIRDLEAQIARQENQPPTSG